MLWRFMKSLLKVINKHQCLWLSLDLDLGNLGGGKSVLVLSSKAEHPIPIPNNDMRFILLV